jgi:hypothetical protein
MCVLMEQPTGMEVSKGCSCTTDVHTTILAEKCLEPSLDHVLALCGFVNKLSVSLPEESVTPYISKHYLLYALYCSSVL